MFPPSSMEWARVKVTARWATLVVCLWICYTTREGSPGDQRRGLDLVVMSCLHHDLLVVYSQCICVCKNIFFFNKLDIKSVYL